VLMAVSANTDEMSYGLKALSQKYLGIHNLDEVDLKEATKKARRVAAKKGWLLGGFWKHDAMGELKWESQVEADYWIPHALNPKNRLCEKYCVLDGERTMLLYKMYSEVLVQEEQYFIYEAEMELLRIVMEMEDRGVLVLWQELRSEISRVLQETKEWFNKLVEYAGHDDFNPNSPDQVGKMLIRNNVQITEWTPTGRPRTGTDYLTQNAGDPVVDALINYRSRANVLASFLWRFYDLSIGNPPILHPEFNQGGARTGRFSCANPNMQNIRNQQTPRSYVSLEPRSVIGPRPGYVWYSIDYSQLEGTIFADIAQEQRMLDAINSGRDMLSDAAEIVWHKDNPKTYERIIHAMRASKEFDVERMSRDEALRVAKELYQKYGGITPTEEAITDRSVSRGIIKMVFFCKIFGGGVKTLASIIQSSFEEAQEIMSSFDRSFPEVNDYINLVSERAFFQGYVTNRYGRKIRVDPKFSYRGVNYQVQGSAADLLKRAMRRSYRWMREQGIDGHIVLTIHDEIVFEIRRTHAKKSVVKKLIEIMQDHGGAFSVPLKVKVALIEKQWSSKNEITV